MIAPLPNTFRELQVYGREIDAADMDDRIKMKIMTEILTRMMFLPPPPQEEEQP